MDGARVIIDSIIEKIQDYLVEAVCTAIIGLIVGCLWPHIVREIQNQNLRKKIQQLERVMDNIERKTDEADERNPGEIVSSKCSEWLQEASVAKADAEKFLDEIWGRKSWRNLWKKVIYSRYLLIKKSRAIDQLVKRAPLLDYEDFESRKSVFEEIMKALKDERRRVIGIWGMGGVGKTTMVKKVRALAKKEHTFDEVVLAVVSQNPVVMNIQGQLADQLGVTLQGETEVGRADSLRTRLLKDEKKILVILDDIWDELDLEEIGIPFADGVMGSKILLTSRKRNLCRDQNPIYIRQLSEEEAWNLFRKKVGNTIKSHDIPPDLPQQVCRKCGGLPVAILAVAGALKSKDKPIWKNALRQLNTSNLKEIEGVNEQVCASLMFSYNQLEHEATKSCFLFCCLFPEDFDIPIELLTTLGRGMGILGAMEKLGDEKDRIYGLVDKLKDYSLLLEGEDKEHVKMHDVVRHVAISIASQGQFLIKTGEDLEEWPEQETSNSYTAISLLFRSIGIQEIPDGWECLKLHTLMLRSSYNGDFDIPDIFFDGMKKLKVLFLEGRRISSLPPSIQNLNDLRVLHLECWKLGDITLIGKLKTLEMLILCCPGVHVLPTEIGDFTRLRLLDLRGCTKLNLISPLVISCLSKLEELFLPMESEMFWGCGGIENHEKCADLAELIPLSQLESLEICVPNFDMWPQEPFYPFLTRLTSFKISINSFLNKGECGAWKKILKLKDVPLRCGVDALLKKSETLYISELKDLKDWSMDNGDVESFSDLTCLHASSCEGVQEFMVNVLERQYLLERQSHLESLSKLRVLKIKKCNFKYLLSPSAAKVLVRLQELSITKCENVEAIVESYEVASIGGVQAEDLVDTIRFSSLKHLWLGNLPKLVGFYPKMEQTSGLGESLQFPVQPLLNEKVAFPELEELRIDNVGGCKAMVGLHLPAQQSFSKLRKLSVENMNHLSTIGSSTLFPRLQSLQELDINSCGSLRAVFNAERNELSEGEEIVATDNGKAIAVELPTLHSLSIQGCSLLEEFFRDSSPRSNEATNTARPFFGDRVAFPELQHLEIDGAGECKEIVGLGLPAQKSFSKLRVLTVIRMSRLSIIGSSTLIPRLQNLQRLHISDCGSLRAIFKTERRQIVGLSLPALRILSIEKCWSLEEFCWKDRSQSIEKREETTFFDNTVAFPELEELEIDGAGECKGIVGYHLPAQQSFSKLRELSVSGMKGLSSIGSSTLIPRLQNLIELYLSTCDSLRAVFKAERNEISRGEEIVAIDNERAIPVAVFQLPTLHWLSIVSCGSLEDFFWDSCPQSNEATNIARPFFSNRVAFPELERLVIDNVGKLEEIVLRLPAQPSFSKLRNLSVKNMNHLSTIGSSTLIPRLQSLQELYIENCGSLSAVFAIDNDEVFQLPALQLLWIIRCGLLDSCPRSREVTNTARPFFSDRIGFPKLSNLDLRGMKKVKEIWKEDGIRPPPPHSFCNLIQLVVSDCPKLGSVIPAAILPRLHHLEILDVWDCDSVRVVIEVVVAGSEEVVEEDEEGHSVFSALPKLRSISLINLPNLENLPRVTAAAAAAGGGSVSSPPSSFLAFKCLSCIKIERCGRLRNLFSSPSTALAFLAPHNLQCLEIRDCEEMEEIVSCCSAASSDAFQIIFPKLQFLELKDLPNLTTLCPSGYRLFSGSSLFDKQIENCPKLHASTPESNATGFPNFLYWIRARLLLQVNTLHKLKAALWTLLR